ncbi:MAG: hypothetical protein HC927_06460 [Deltaproteobacteria bacterium]|nr:hypothetical protein [Deltaproteobacteria bacterium]
MHASRRRAAQPNAEPSRPSAPSEPEPEPAPEPTVAEPEPTPEPTPASTPEARSPGEKIQIPVDIGDRHSITYTSLLAPRVNPLGLEERLWIGYQYRLYDKTGDVFRGSNIGIFVRPILSPAIGLLGPTLQIQPLAVLRLRATWSFVGWFGTFDYMQSYQSPWDDFSDTRLDEQTLRGENYATWGHQTELELLLQLRFKQIALRNTLTANYNDMKLRGDDDVYYDIRIDAMVPNKGWVIFNETDLMWLQDFKSPRHPSLLAGVRATVVKSFYPDSVYELGDERSDPNGPMLRIGPNIGYVFYDQPQKRPRFNRPTLLLIPQWNILHRWRTGRDVAVGYPTITLAFVFTGQLWGKN